MKHKVGKKKKKNSPGMGWKWKKEKGACSLNTLFRSRSFTQIISLLLKTIFSNYCVCIPLSLPYI